MHLLDLHPWSFLKAEALVTTYAPITTGTVNVTNNSTTVTGNDTGWTSAVVGRYFRCGQSSTYYLITGHSGSTITLEKPYSGETATSQKYIIFQHQYNKPADCKNLLSVRYQHQLANVAKMWLDSLEPDRTSVGQPLYWLDLTNTKFEIWPVPDQVYTLRLWYNKLIPELSNETDTTLIPERLVLSHARMSAYLQMMPTKKEYLELYRIAQEEYNDLLQAAIEEDMRKLSLPRRVIVEEAQFPQSNDYWLQHDVLDPRRWNI